MMDVTVSANTGRRPGQVWPGFDPHGMTGRLVPWAFSGRFLSVDPGRDGMNLYAYVDGNAINRWDPDGMRIELLDWRPGERSKEREFWMLGLLPAEQNNFIVTIERDPEGLEHHYLEFMAKDPSGTGIATQYPISSYAGKQLADVINDPHIATAIETQEFYLTGANYPSDLDACCGGAKVEGNIVYHTGKAAPHVRELGTGKKIATPRSARKVHELGHLLDKWAKYPKSENSAIIAENLFRLEQGLPLRAYE